MAMSRKRRTIVATIIVLVVFAVTVAVLWRTILASGSVETLDRVDSWLSDAEVDLATQPVLYGDHPAQRLFVHKPAGDVIDARLPVLAFVHGGSWSHGDPAAYNFIARTFAPQGFVVVNIGYRLVPEGKFPHMNEDTAAAIRWIHENIADAGGDPEAIYLMGHSAGAYNAVMVGLDRQWLGREGLDDDVLKGVIGLAGPYDFYPFDGDGTRNAFGNWERPEATQPINLVRGDAPPMLLATGDKDTTVRPRNTRVLADAITQAGGSVETAFFEGMDHARPIMALARPFARDGRVFDAVSEFIRKQEEKTASGQANAAP